ncbi:hypothetical protein [Nocardia rhamnosiphila]
MTTAERLRAEGEAIGEARGEVRGEARARTETLIDLFEHDAAVVVVPHLNAAEIRAERCWRAVSGLAHILAADGAWLR